MGCNTWENGILGDRVIVSVMSPLQIEHKAAGLSGVSHSFKILPSLSFMRWDHWAAMLFRTPCARRFRNTAVGLYRTRAKGSQFTSILVVQSDDDSFAWVFCHNTSDVLLVCYHFPHFLRSMTLLPLLCLCAGAWIELTKT